MKFLKFFIVSIVFSVTFTSCREAQTEVIDPPTDQTIGEGSAVSDLMMRTSLQDGSADNIIDKSSAIMVTLPVSVVANGTNLSIEDKSGYKQIEDIFEISDIDIDTLQINYPIIVTMSDYSQQTLYSHEELTDIAEELSVIEDEDIECIDFQYPISFSVYNENNELIETVVLESDEELYAFILGVTNYTAVTLNFPVTLVLFDGWTQEVFSTSQLEQALEEAEGLCDEDDDNDYDDDDCTSCTTSDIDSLLATCNTFKIHRFNLNDENLKSFYTQYTFSFEADSVLTVLDENGTTLAGTWTADGSGNNIAFSLQVEGLDQLNQSWLLHELEVEEDETEISLRYGQNRLKFEGTCGSDSDDDDHDDDDDDSDDDHDDDDDDSDDDDDDKG